MRLRAGVQIVEGTDGAFLLDTRKGIYWHLNEPAVQLLTALGEGRSFDEVVKDTAAAFDVDEVQVRSDYVGLVDELRRSRLVEGSWS